MPPGPRVVRVVVAAPEQAGFAGWTIQMTATAYDSAGAVVADARFTWTSANTQRASVDTTGLVTIGTEPGGTSIVVTEDSSGVADSVLVHLAREGEIRWAVQTTYPPSTLGGPTLDRDGTLWVLTDAPIEGIVERSVLVHLAPDGRTLCTVLLDGVLANLVAVPPAGDWVWVTGSTVYQVGPSCDVRQSVTVWVQPDFIMGAVGADGTLFQPAADSLVAIAPDLTPRWAIPRNGSGHAWLGPVTVTPSRVYAKVTADSLYALDAATGATLWSQPEADTSVDLVSWGHGPAVVPGRVYVPARFSFVAYDTTGTRLWKSPQDGTGTSEPAVTADGRLFVQLQEAMVVWDPDGNVLWQSAYGKPRWAGWVGGPALGEDGRLYVAGDQGFYAFDLDGNVLWDVRAVAGDSTWFAGSPAIAPDGTIYTWAGTHVYAIFGTHPPDPTSPWPMWRHDAQRTGRVP